MVSIVSVHRGNVDTAVLESQKKVFSHFGYEVDQRLIDKRHGAALDDVLNSEEGLVLIADIDCVPLVKWAVPKALTVAECGGLYGAAGFDHTTDDRFVYVHPCWMALHAGVWRDLGSVSCYRTSNRDTAGRLTDAWTNDLRAVDMVMPTSTEIRLWPFPDGNHATGIGTTYGHEFYHLFCGSSGNHTDRFVRKCEEIISGTTVERAEGGG